MRPQAPLRAGKRAGKQGVRGLMVRRQQSHDPMHTALKQCLGTRQELYNKRLAIAYALMAFRASSVHVARCKNETHIIFID